MRRINGFAPHIIDTPAVGACPGSVDELAALGLDKCFRLAYKIRDQGEANVVKSRIKILYTLGILMEDRNEDAEGATALHGSTPKMGAKCL